MRKETDPATPIEVRVGDEFTIVVQSNPSTGYRWKLAEPPKQPAPPPYLPSATSRWYNQVITVPGGK